MEKQSALKGVKGVIQFTYRAEMFVLYDLT